VPAKRAAASAGKLATYRAKRDFSRTAEPAGAKAKSPGKKRANTSDAKASRRKKRTGDGRYVIHEHHARRLHWDLRLERDGVLASWAVPNGIPLDPGENRFAAATEDHPLEYLEFAGEIPKGEYGAGKISIWDRGTYETLKWEPRKIEVALHGERLDARYALFPIASGERPKEWMIHRMDPPADPSGEPMPSALAPMLATSGPLPREDAEFAYEIKWDGIRAIAYSQPGRLRLESRNRNDITAQYPELARLNRALGSHSAVLDGEIVSLGADGRPSFQALQKRMHLGSPAQAKTAAKHAPVTYQIFDLLWLDGHPLMDFPYAQRREQLAALGLSDERYKTPEHIVGGGASVLRASSEQGLEGIVAKRLDSSYTPGRRTRAWIKVKNVGREEFVIGGWTPGKGSRGSHLGALLVGVPDEDGLLRYAGSVGSGFTTSELERLRRLLSPLSRERSPFARGGAGPPRGASFCEPRLVAEVEFSGWTDGGRLRHPTYKGLREELIPAVPRARTRTHTRAAGDDEAVQRLEAEGAVVLERTRTGAAIELDGRELTLSNLDKPLYPSARFRKLDVIEYYLAIAPTLLAHLEGRALTLKRWPDGVEGHFFFEKQAPSHRAEWVRTVRIEHREKPVDYVLADDRPTLVWLANLAALELHTPLALARDIDRPTTLVFDLDPGAPATIRECARVALTLQGMFENLGLRSFAKTSGKKGLQVYVPLNSPRVRFDDTKPFAKAVAEMLERAEPELVVSSMSKSRRSGKVLIDWSQNDRRKTTVAVYSLRAEPRPTVSTPLEWDEVRAALKSRAARALTFDAPAVLERVRVSGDLFAPVLSLVQRPPAI
jgi:bifunctional non-homologous end joining protein LigD